MISRRFKVFNELKTRSCLDILIAVVGVLKGLAEAIGKGFPCTTVQNCMCSPPISISVGRTSSSARQKLARCWGPGARQYSAAPTHSIFSPQKTQLRQVRLDDCLRSRREVLAQHRHVLDAVVFVDVFQPATISASTWLSVAPSACVPGSVNARSSSCVLCLNTSTKSRAPQPV